jgi:hypothetical protein
VTGAVGLSRPGPGDWDALAERRIRLDVYIDDLRQEPGPSAPGQWDSVSGVLLYPRRPTDSARAKLVEQVADREALMVVWYDETDWM